MPVRYIKLNHGESLPDTLGLPDFKCLVLLPDKLDGDHMDSVIEWLLHEGAVYVLTHGFGCEEFHDRVDETTLHIFGESRFVITTWHDDEPVSEAIWNAKYCSHHPDFETDEILIVDTGTVDREAEMLRLYQEA